MKRKLGRLLRPGMGLYFVVLVLFVVAAALMQDYLLAVGEALFTMALLGLYLLSQKRRRADLAAYLK